MTQSGLLQIIVYLLGIALFVKPLGGYMARVYMGKAGGIGKLLSPVEHFLYRLSGIKPKQEMDWKQYLITLFLFNLIGMLATYAIQRLQAHLPLNRQMFPAVSPMLAFNTAASFVTNTNWQNYAGEATLSDLTQMFALTVQNFLSAATSMAILAAFIRGLVRHESQHVGNFWVDLTRGVLYILLPLSLILAVFLSSQGVIQNFKPYQTLHLLQPLVYEQPKSHASGFSLYETNSSRQTGNPSQQQANNPIRQQASYPPERETKILTTQTIPMGPVASQIAIKQLGSNGGGFFNTNSAHPFENPTPLTNFLEMLAILLIPAALCYTFGAMVNDKKQGWAVLITMLILFLPLAFFTVMAEQNGNPAFAELGISSNRNMEGKEARLGVVDSALWATATTATSNGSVNTMHSSLTPLSLFTLLWSMHLGEIVFGGVGSGLYGMLLAIIITVFIAGLMVGRTPEYLGKRIDPYEMKMAAIAVLLMPLSILLLTAIGCGVTLTDPSAPPSSPHHFSEILYAFTSMGNNNGSAMAALNTHTDFYNITGAFIMLLMRFWIVIPTLAIAGSLARKKIIPATLGTLPTHTPLFIVLTIVIITVMGALTFFPALALGPIVEQLTLWKHYGN